MKQEQLQGAVFRSKASEGWAFTLVNTPWKQITNIKKRREKKKNFQESTVIICYSYLSMVRFSQIAFLLINQLYQEDGICLLRKEKQIILEHSTFRKWVMVCVDIMRAKTPGRGRKKGEKCPDQTSLISVCGLSREFILLFFFLLYLLLFHVLLSPLI